jgi:peptidyl-prolyl cis-trans isomerase D
MLQNIRENIQGTVAKIVVGLIVVSFSIFGIESILLGGGGGGVAEVNGEEITPQELQQAVNTQRRRLVSMMGENVDPALLDDDRLRPRALESLIDRKLLTQAADRLALAVSEREIGSVIGSMEQFQIDGKFAPEVYKNALSNAGYTPAWFKQTLRQDLVVNQLTSGLSGSDFATPAELELTARITGEQRDVRYLTVPVAKFRSEEGAEVADAQVEAFYTANQSDFRTAESVDLDYIQLNADDFRAPVEESAIVAAYEAELQNGQYRTENRVSHIMFERSKDETEKAFGERIAAARARLDAGDPFADVAREYSDDVGSAGNGGDLGFSSGDAFPEEMEMAIAALSPGEVSAPVETAEGTHLILVTERREGKPPTLEEMRGQLEEKIQLDEARVELLRTVETLRDLAFNAESLDNPAAELGLEVKHAAGVTRAQAEGLFANPVLTEAAFSEEVLDEGHNSEVIELGGDSYVVLRVRKHHPAQLRPLDEVRDEIVERIVEERARAATLAEAERIAVQLRAGGDLQEVAGDRGYEWRVEPGADRRNTTLPQAVLQRVFTLPAPEEGESVVDFVAVPSGDVSVVEVTRVAAGSYDELPEGERLMLQRQVSAEYSALVGTEFQEGLRDDADITTL